MPEPTARPPLSDRTGVTDAVRAQLLATEHWNLLSTRSMAWNEAFSRAGMFLTVLSASVVALALVAQATEFGRTFRVFALLLLPVVLFLGWATYSRLTYVAGEDLWLVVGMNRLRHAYLELAPELEPYFVTSQYDDEAGVIQTMNFSDKASRLKPARVLSSTVVLVGIISAVVAGAFVGLAVAALGSDIILAVAAGVVAGLVYAVITFAAHARSMFQFRNINQPRFPRPGSSEV